METKLNVLLPSSQYRAMMLPFRIYTGLISIFYCLYIDAYGEVFRYREFDLNDDLK